jgi:hypothetical protein
LKEELTAIEMVKRKESPMEQRLNQKKVRCWEYQKGLRKELELAQLMALPKEEK